MSIESISRIQDQAEEAAKWHADVPTFPKPKNPYFADVQPFHHATWQDRFDAKYKEYEAARKAKKAAREGVSA